MFVRLTRSYDPWVCAAWVDGRRIVLSGRERLSRFLAQHPGCHAVLDVCLSAGIASTEAPRWCFAGETLSRGRWKRRLWNRCSTGNAGASDRMRSRLAVEHILRDREMKHRAGVFWPARGLV